MQPDQEIIDRWTKSAPFWESHREVISQMLAPITQALIDDADIGSGQTVLDVGTGSGEPALTLAGIVGAGGKIHAIDPIPAMVEAARREADRQGLQNVQFEVAFAGHLPFAANTFDAAVSRLGAMFFPSIEDAAREILRVLKPGKKLALAVWNFAEKNPFHSVLSQVMDRYVKPEPLAPDALEAFRFAPPGKLRDTLSRAGAIAPRERLFQFKIEAAMSVEDFWELRRQMSDKLREKLAALAPSQLESVNRDALEALAKYYDGAGMSFPAEVLIVSGTKAEAT